MVTRGLVGVQDIVAHYTGFDNDREGCVGVGFDSFNNCFKPY